jgi:6-pyruvoyltetrahydropterin/6-carboxytetrahydropterin synthase
MNYYVYVERKFSAAHALRGYKGKCERLHGHNWVVRVSLTGKKLDKTGMLLDFTELRALVDGVLAKLDHCYINEVPPFDKQNPTAELIAAHVFTEMKKLKLHKGVAVHQVRVWESDASCAIVTQ